MNKFLNLFTAALFVSLAIFVSCGGGSDPDPEPDPKDVQADLLTAGAASFSSVTLDGTASAQDWANFVLTFTGDGNGGSYSTQGVPQDASVVWPASGTWTFDGDDVTRIIRSDQTPMTASVNASQLVLTFEITEETGRVQGLAGTWRFTLQY